ITDGMSRFLIGLHATSGTGAAEAQPLFEQAFETYGLPDTLRTDNGSPFASAGVTGLTQLSAWWIQLGIKVERIAPGKP
ncbi:transposase family protein, partial [Acinetobacter baumannii]